MNQLVEFASRDTYHVLIVAGLVAAALAVAFYELRLRATGALQVSAADAVRLINRGALVIDVRKPDEYAAGHIVNARNVALDKLQQGDDAIKKQKDKILLTVCDTGAIAGKAADLLRRGGYANVFNIRGGLATWRAENLPLVK
jgi:rhodanese-related sulfurtransferase